MDAADHRETHPGLFRDGSFWGMTGTQLLGAFNDNLFKQLILLWCVDLITRGAADIYQPLAMIVFSLPFILFSGYAGYLADRYSKRRIIVLCKAAEIGVMLCGMLAFWRQDLVAIFAVLFCMGAHSAFFGPSKYGILPELLRERDIPAANGVFQSTTFLAIILGQVLAGLLKDQLSHELWKAGGVCMVIACIGTATALLIRPTRSAQPQLRFEFSATGVAASTWKLLYQDRKMFRALLLSSLFWLVGGVVNQVVNAVGKQQFQLGDKRTSLMLGGLALGIGAGCAVCGALSRGRVNFRLVRIGGWGIVICCFLLALPGGRMVQSDTTIGSVNLSHPLVENGAMQSTSPVISGDATHTRDRSLTLLGPAGSVPVLVCLGIFAGLYAVPLQVFLQLRPPADQKGRVLGAMNMVNFIGILMSGGFYALSDRVCALLSFPRSANFAAVGMLILLALIFYPPDDSAV